MAVYSAKGSMLTQIGRGLDSNATIEVYVSTSFSHSILKAVALTEPLQEFEEAMPFSGYHGP